MCIIYSFFRKLVHFFIGHLQFTTTHLEKRDFGQNQGGAKFLSADILQNCEYWESGANTDIGTKEYFEIACTTIII
jgi:hypothetical protein